MPPENAPEQQPKVTELYCEHQKEFYPLEMAKRIYRHELKRLSMMDASRDKAYDWLAGELEKLAQEILLCDPQWQVPVNVTDMPDEQASASLTVGLPPEVLEKLDVNVATQRMKLTYTRKGERTEAEQNETLLRIPKRAFHHRSCAAVSPP